MKIDKEELQWWIEDHKSKFYGICAIGVLFICVIVFGLVSMLTPEPEPVVEEPDTYEEIEIGGFDTEGAIQEQKETEEERRNNEYGLIYCLSNYQYYDGANYGYGFVNVTNKEDGSTFRLLINDSTYKGAGDMAVSSSNWNFLMQDSNTYTCRGTFEYLDSKTIASWRERDYREVLDLFKNKDFNADTAAKWDELFIECKVEKGYKKKEKIENIKPEDMSDILNDMYFIFEDYLLSLDTDSDGLAGPLTTYLQSNPLPMYNDVMIVKTPFYICEKDGNIWSIFGENGVNSYFDAYWGTYFLTSEELFINEGDQVFIAERELKDGVPYKMTKAVNFSLNGDVYNKEFVMWYKTNDRKMNYKYVPANEWNLEEKNESFLNIPSNAEYFGYYIIGEIYPIKNTNEITRTIPSGEDFVSETRKFVIQDNIVFKREDFCGNNPYLNVSEFIMLDGEYEVPTSKVYLKNDTEYTISLYSHEKIMDLLAGEEVFFNPLENRIISWKVVD